MLLIAVRSGSKEGMPAQRVFPTLVSSSESTTSSTSLMMSSSSDESGTVKTSGRAYGLGSGQYLLDHEREQRISVYILDSSMPKNDPHFTSRKGVMSLLDRIAEFQNITRS